MKVRSLLLTALLAACADTPEEMEQKLQAAENSTRRFDDAVLAIVAAAKGDGKALAALIGEQSSWDDANILARIGSMIREGKIKVTQDGLAVVPESEWPDD